MPNIIWRTHDGRRILIEHLDTDHLVNCICMIRRGHDRLYRPVMPGTRAILPHLEREYFKRVRGYRNALWC